MKQSENHEAQEFLNRYIAGSCSPEEELIVNAWFNQQAESSPNFTDPDDIDLIGEDIWTNLPPAQRSYKLRIWRKLAAAAALILISFSIIQFIYHDSPVGTQIVRQKNAKFSPGDYGATLSLANGKQISLSTLGNGVLVREPGVSITKTSKGELVYQITGEPSERATTNTLSTARGQTFKVNLPDGSSVWLNAASSITYSTNLAHSEVRTVRLNGEAYFKVAHDSKHPFVVKTNGQEVTVLGTEFNVSAYADDHNETTTLVQGKIAMNTAINKVILSPGEKGTVENGIIEKAVTNVESAIGWKNNEFVFASQDIRGIMKILSRWYDVDVEYAGEIPSERFSGSTTRFADIHSVLSILESTGSVKINASGAKIIVSGKRK